MKLDKEFQETLIEASLGDSTKIIRYLQEQERKQKPYNLAILVFTVISAIGAIIAAVTGILVYLQ